MRKRTDKEWAMKAFEFANQGSTEVFYKILSSEVWERADYGTQACFLEQFAARRLGLADML